MSMRVKLHLASTIINGTLGVLSNLTSHARVLGGTMRLDRSLRRSLTSELDQISTDMRIHRSAVQNLLGLSKDLCLVVKLSLFAVEIMA
jgi:hypothetical protein